VWVCGCVGVWVWCVCVCESYLIHCYENYSRSSHLAVVYSDIYICNAHPHTHIPLHIHALTHIPSHTHHHTHTTHHHTHTHTHAHTHIITCTNHHTPHITHTRTHIITHKSSHTHTCTHTHTHTHTHIHSASGHNRCCIRFLPSRVEMQSMHYAVDLLDLNTIFPSSQTNVTNSKTSPSIKRCLHEVKNSKLNNSQQNAITSMLDPACSQVDG